MGLRFEGRVSPAMAVALTGVVIALGGSAFAASGGFAGTDGTVQGCVAQENIVQRVTDGVDSVTNGVLAPVTQAVDQAAGAVDPATGGALDAVTQIVTPKGSLIIVSQGSACPTGYTPQTISQTPAQLPQVVSSQSTAPKAVGSAKAEVAEAMLPAGSYLVNATADISDRAASPVEQTVKCALVEPDGNVIPGTTAQATIPPNTPGDHLTMPISATVDNVPAGMLKLACKDVSSSNAGRAASAAASGSATSSGSVSATQVNSAPQPNPASVPSVCAPLC